MNAGVKTNSEGAAHAVSMAESGWFSEVSSSFWLLYFLGFVVLLGVVPSYLVFLPCRLLSRMSEGAHALGGRSQVLATRLLFQLQPWLRIRKSLQPRTGDCQRRLQPHP